MSNKKNLAGVIAIVSLALLGLGGAKGLLAQNAAGLLKKLILLKYDINHDGALVGIEKEGAVIYLKKADKDNNGEISEKEAKAAIVTLREMSSPTKQTETKTRMLPKVEPAKRPPPTPTPRDGLKKLSGEYAGEIAKRFPYKLKPRKKVDKYTSNSNITVTA